MKTQSWISYSLSAIKSYDLGLRTHKEDTYVGYKIKGIHAEWLVSPPAFFLKPCFVLNRVKAQAAAA